MREVEENMKKKVICIIFCLLFVIALLPSAVHAEHNDTQIVEKSDGKKLVHIEGYCGSYGLGSFFHLGKLWWCPNYPITFGFFPEDLYTFEINDIPQDIDSEHDTIQIEMDNFFGVAPTLVSFVFIPPRAIFVFGICDEVRVRELG